MSDSTVFSDRLVRVERVMVLVREAVELLSTQVNDEMIFGGVPEGMRAAEQSCRNTLRQLSGLATAEDARNFCQLGAVHDSDPSLVEGSS